MTATAPKTKNRYDRMEWAGAFGDLGTLIPFVVAYITIVKVDPFGLLLMFGIAKIVSGFYYRTPFPIQPMKAIGAAAIAGGITPAALFASGLTTGLFWLLAGVTGAIRPISRLATKPVVRGILLAAALVILGSLLVLIALFFSDSVAIFFKVFPNAILGVILFFAGSELAIVVRDRCCP